MYPANFRYHRAKSFEQASRLLVELGRDARAIAGGQTLIPMLKLRLVKPSDVVDLRHVAGATDIAETADTVEIGALACHAAIGHSALAQRHPIIKDCALGIADAQVRNMGTIGGSIAEADPSSCWPALLVALDASVRCQGPAGARVQAVRDLLADAYTPNLEPAELITHVILDKARLAGVGSFVAFKRCAPAYPTASCALSITYEGERVVTATMGFGCLGLTPLAFDPTDVLRGQRISDEAVREVGERASEFVAPIADNKGTEAYKRSLVRGLVKRAFDAVERRRRGEAVEETHVYYG
jgi:carbon-monoxide dehydrogenase medium subunit